MKKQGRTTGFSRSPLCSFESCRLVCVDAAGTATALAEGGTGVAFDWEVARATLFQNAEERKFVAAGGLTPANVAEAIVTLRPWGVDAVSGVEVAAGRKDPVKVREFVTNAHAAARD